MEAAVALHARTVDRPGSTRPREGLVAGVAPMIEEADRSLAAVPLMFVAVDDAAIRRVLDHLIRSAGWQVRTCRSVQDVLASRRDCDGEGYRGVAYLLDMSERARSRDTLDRAASELAHVSRLSALSGLTASITHEVNQPLSGIVANANACLRMLDATPPNVDGAREAVRRTIRDGARASDVITRLREMFTKRDFTLESIDLNESVREVIALLLSELRRKGITLNTQLADDLHIVNGDRIQLQQVVLNLVRNAADAMQDVHDRPRQVSIQTKNEGSRRVRLIVRDTGIGLSAQCLDSLFEAFYTTKSGGMGIGLFVSRSIIERHRGRLWAEPNDDVPGATFAFSIPRCGQA
jgi:C4-dicarboxylate-specific signal transduction histidine kinase